MRLAVVQMKISHQNPKTNMARTEMFIKKAVKQKADVVIFPEDMLTGSIFGDRSKLISRTEFCAFFQKLAKKYRIDIVPGTYMEKAKGKIFNTAHYIDSQGKVLATYRKINLYLCERSTATPGNNALVFKTKFGKAALAICWDITSPEIFRTLTRRGAEMVFCPSYWWKEIAGTGLKLNKNTEEMKVDALCAARALENNLTIVYANAAGVMKNPDGEIDTLIGHSQIVTPILGQVACAKHNRETLIVRDIDLNLNHEAEKNYQHRCDVLAHRPIIR